MNKIFFIAAVAIAAWQSGHAAEITVTLPEVAKTLSNAKSGDVIKITSGEYSDIELKWRSPERDITVKALEPKGVKLTGKSSLKISGEDLTVEGIDFVKAHPEKGNVMEFRIGKDLANGCRLTKCTFDSCNPPKRDIVSSYVVLHGRNNRVDHCSFTGKLSLGVTCLVNLNNSESLNNHHRIDHNYFGHRPVYGSNGAETMRIGTSQQSYETSATVVEENYFDRCNGEVEVISVKSCDNIVRNNVFNECQGVVALRHGKRNTVTGNIFNGNGVRNTGGVRIVDSGHKVSDNIFCNLRGGRFFSALAFMNSVPNSLPNRYVQVSDVLVEKNTFIDCSNIEFGTGKDMERTQAPIDCKFIHNTVMTDKENPYIIIDNAAQIEFADNKIEPINPATIKEVRKKCEKVLSETGYKESVVAENPDETVIELPGDVVYRSEPYVISVPTVIKGNGTTLKWKGSGGGNFITIADGGSLKVSDVTFDGALQQGCAVVKNAIATANGMVTPYCLEVDDCSFLNMPESGCCAIKGSKGTFAETFTVRNCSFSDLSGNAVSLADETDDKGRYSAEDITISGCRFNHLLGIPVNIYRGGSDESTAGPYVTISDCSFTDCCNRERGSVLRLIGPQKLTVEGCNFTDSGRGGGSIRLDETTWEDVAVKGCTFENSGRIISNRNVLQ